MSSWAILIGLIAAIVAVVVAVIYLRGSGAIQKIQLARALDTERRKNATTQLI